MCRGQRSGDSGEQGNKQQPPGTMLTRDYQGSPAGALSCTFSFTILGHGPFIFRDGIFFHSPVHKVTDANGPSTGLLSHCYAYLAVREWVRD